VTNASATSNVPPVAISATTFYTGLLDRHTKNDALLKGAMKVTLPGNDGRRQVDTAVVGMLSSLNNYVGNQANYGFGATYVARTTTAQRALHSCSPTHPLTHSPTRPTNSEA
jgi:hypothetical protein